MFMRHKYAISAVVLLCGLASLGSAEARAAVAPADAGWSGNFARDPGFEEDFVNNNAEAQVLSFKGDWFYNQRDLSPDYWALKGAYSWPTKAAHGGAHSLVLAAGATAIQTYQGAIYQEGGSAWGAAPTKPITLTHPERFAQPWRLTIWCRGGGTVQLGPITAKAPEGAEWQMLTVECPAAQVPKDGTMTVTLTGPGEFDDLTVQEKLADTPNLLANAGFEKVDAKGYPTGWSEQRKFDWIGPTYYVWTDWMHFHEGNRGRVGTDPLVFHGGKQSLRFDVFPGDEKFVESTPITLNQDQPHVIEVGVYVAADRIKMFDIRAVDEDGANLPGYYPIQPEYSTGGSATFGNGTFGWRYVRKFFALPFNEPVKSIKVRLAARGFNANTLDDSGTRAYACQAGTIWWDDLRVTERTSTATELKARNVAIPTEPAATSDIVNASVDLGERLYGDNELAIDLTNAGAAGDFRVRVTTTLPDGKPVISQGPSLKLARNAGGTLKAPYAITKLAGDLMSQGTLRVELLRDTKVARDVTYAFNTWPVVVDFDLTRHYNLPDENPVTTSLNLGVASKTLAKVKQLQVNLRRNSDGASVGGQTIGNLNEAMTQSLTMIPKEAKDSYEFNMPTPAYWADRTNLLLLKLDLGKLKVWPHDNPTRDTVVEVKGLDAAGKVLFSDTSDGICRVAAPPVQEAIKTVKVREDGAVLINDKPRYLFGATHQQQRLNHDFKIISQLGLMGHRLTGNKYPELKKMWEDYKIYGLQIKPGSGDGTTQNYVEFPDDKRKELEQFVKEGGMDFTVSVNTGGWESHIPDDDASRTKHQAVNDYIRRITNRPLAWSPSGAYNAWNINDFPYYDIVHGETEMWGPMDYNTIFLPYQKRLRKDPTTWVYLPQLYENTPYERYRFETYENIIRGSAGVSMIQGIGDPTFNRGLAGELRYLEVPLNSLEKAPEVTLSPNVSHMTRQYQGKTYVLATNAGPIIMGRWNWNKEIKQSGTASHEGDSINRNWMRPDGVRIHGFRGLPLPEMVQPGDKIVQYIWLDPKEKPDWAMVAVRGDGKFSHAGVLGNFDFAKFRENYGNVLMYSELEHSVWHEIYWVMDQPLYERAIKLMGKEWADGIKSSADAGRATVDQKIYKAADFHKIGAAPPAGAPYASATAGTMPAAGAWYRMEMDAGELGLTGKLIDGFAYLTHNGRALWDNSSLERNGKVVRVFCEDSVGIDRAQLTKVTVKVPGLKAGTKVKALFEDRTIIARDGEFDDNFQGVDTYGYEAGAVAGDMFGYVKDDNRDLPRMMPSGYGYSYGPTAVHIYEIEP